MRNIAGACLLRSVCSGSQKETCRGSLRDITGWMSLGSVRFCADAPMRSSHPTTRPIPGRRKPRRNSSFCSHGTVPPCWRSPTIRLDAARRLQPELSHLVKINFIPAIRRTVARKSEITRTARRLLPRCEPTRPPVIAAIERTRPSEGIE